MTTGSQYVTADNVMTVPHLAVLSKCTLCNTSRNTLHYDTLSVHVTSVIISRLLKQCQNVTDFIRDTCIEIKI